MTLPIGPAVVFLFTDIEGSTRLERSVGSVPWADVVARHDELLRAEIEGRGGVVVKTEGDAFFAAFDSLASPRSRRRLRRSAPSPPSRGRAPWPLKVRMGIHLGEGRLRSGRAAGEPEDYVGIDVNYAAQIAAAANGGQIVLSDALVGTLPRDLARSARAERRRARRRWPASGQGLRRAHPVVPARRPRRRRRRPSAPDDGDPHRTFRATSPRSSAARTRARRLGRGPARQPDRDADRSRREWQDPPRARDVLGWSWIVSRTGSGSSTSRRVRDPDLLESAVASTLGVRETPDRTIDEALHGHLASGRSLLVLDNLEQLLPDGADDRGAARPGRPQPPGPRDEPRAAPDHRRARPPGAAAGPRGRCGTVRRPRPCPSVGPHPRRRRVTRRDPGHQRATRRTPARDRAGRRPDPGAQPGRDPRTARGRASTWARGPRDRPSDSARCAAPFDWSYELLPDEERRLFARLSVFVDSWTSEMAPRSPTPTETSASTSSSVSSRWPTRAWSASSTARPRLEPRGRSVRFSLHPLLREYGLERLDESRRAHASSRRGSRPSASRSPRRPGRTILGPAGEATHASSRSRRPEPARRRRLDARERRGAPWPPARRRDLALVPGSAGGSARPGRSWPICSPAGAARRPHPNRRARREGGLAYWMNDFAAARTAYEERLDLAVETGDGCCWPTPTTTSASWRWSPRTSSELLRDHEQRPSTCTPPAGREDGVLRAASGPRAGRLPRRRLREARELETENLEVFRRTGSLYLVADSLTLLRDLLAAGRSGDGLAPRLRRRSGTSDETDSASGSPAPSGWRRSSCSPTVTRSWAPGSPGRPTGWSADKGVMLAPVKVLHLPDPAGVCCDGARSRRPACCSPKATRSARRGASRS